MCPRVFASSLYIILVYNSYHGKALLLGGRRKTSYSKSLFFSMLKWASSSLWSTYFTFSFISIIKARSKKRRRKVVLQRKLKWNGKGWKNCSRNISKIALPISRWNAAYLWTHVTTTHNNTVNFFHLSLSRSRNLAFVFINSLLSQTLGQLGKATALGTTLDILWLLKAGFLQGSGESARELWSPLGEQPGKAAWSGPLSGRGWGGWGGGQSAKRVRLERRWKGSACPGKAVPGLRLLQCNHSLSHCSSHCSATLFGGFFH